MKRLEMSHKRFRMRYNHCDNKIVSWKQCPTQIIILIQLDASECIVTVAMRSKCKIKCELCVINEGKILTMVFMQWEISTI